MRFKMKFRDLPDSGGSKNFVKLKDKESISGIFMGDVHEFFTVWENGKTKHVPEDTPGASLRFRVNFVVKEGAVYVPKIFEQSKTVYRQLSELHEEYDLESIVVKITRNGSGKNDTTYSFLPILKQPLSAQAVEHLKTIQLLPLVDHEHSQAPVNSDGDEIPF